MQRGVKVKEYAAGVFTHYAYRGCACRIFVSQEDPRENARIATLYRLLTRVLDADEALPQLPSDLVNDIRDELKEEED